MKQVPVHLTLQWEKQLKNLTPPPIKLHMEAIIDSRISNIEVLTDPVNKLKWCFV